MGSFEKVDIVVELDMEIVVVDKERLVGSFEKVDIVVELDIVDRERLVEPFEEVDIVVAQDMEVGFDKDYF
jgi:hypothetical protein